MTTTTTTESGPDDTESVLTTLKGARDAITVRRVFGDAYEADGVTIIPVARVAGGGGGGGGEGGQDSDSTGSGYGTGFGIAAHPVGIYEVRNGTVEWKPTVDVNRIARGGQVLAALVALCVAAVLWRRTPAR